MNNVSHIVITGRIGTGKTTYASQLYQKLKVSNIPVLNLDYDELAHAALAQTHNIKTLDERKKLAQTVFSNDDARSTLEQKLHPLVYKLADRRVKKFLSKNKLPIPNTKTYILHQIPLYQCTKQIFQQHFGTPNETVTLTASDAQIIKRLITSRSMTEKEVLARLKAFNC